MADDKLSGALAEIRGRAAKATPGPWKVTVERGLDMDSDPWKMFSVEAPDGKLILGAHVDDPAANSSFAAHAREDVPRLLAAVDEVLKPHHPGRIAVIGALCGTHENHRYFSITQPEAAAVIACPDCAATVYASCAECGEGTPFTQCTVRAAITSALTRDDGNG